MIRPTPLEKLRQPHPDQARIDREAARLLLETAFVYVRAGTVETQPLLKSPQLRGERAQPGV